MAFYNKITEVFCGCQLARAADEHPRARRALAHHLDVARRRRGELAGLFWRIAVRGCFVRGVFAFWAVLVDGPVRTLAELGQFHGHLTCTTPQGHWNWIYCGVG